MLKLHPSFDMRALKALMTTKVVGGAMDDVEMEVMAIRGTASTSEGGAAAKTRASAKTIEAAKAKSAEVD